MFPLRLRGGAFLKILTKFLTGFFLLEAAAEAAEAAEALPGRCFFLSSPLDFSPPRLWMTREIKPGVDWDWPGGVVKSTTAAGFLSPGGVSKSTTSTSGGFFNPGGDGDWNREYILVDCGGGCFELEDDDRLWSVEIQLC